MSEHCSSTRNRSAGSSIGYESSNGRIVYRRGVLAILVSLIAIAAGPEGRFEVGAAPAAAPEAAPSPPTWPIPDLTADVRDLLLAFYGQRATPSTPYYLRAPEWEIDKSASAKDPDTLWEYHGGPGTACHGASTSFDFVDCTGMRLSRAMGIPYWGGLTLFDAQRGYYANEALAQLAGSFALHHAFVHDFDAPIDAVYVPGADPTIRDNKRYHQRMIRAYEAHQRAVIARMFSDTRGSASFQADLTRSVGSITASYARTAQAMEETGAWSSPSARRDSLQLISGLVQRIWWEWVVPQPNGPRTAGFADLGSNNTFINSFLFDPSWAGSDEFTYAGGSVQSLRPGSQDNGAYSGLWFDADFALPGEWWCNGSFTPGTAEHTACTAHARQQALGGTKSPFGQFYGQGGCGVRAPGVTAFSCGETNLGSIGEEWLWTYVGGRAGAYLLRALELSGDPDTPSGSIGGRVYDTFSARLGYGVSGFHGGAGRNDDLEWQFNPPAVVAIRTLSGGRHDDEMQNGRFSLGETDVSTASGMRKGDTWPDDRQEFPGGIENHLPGPSALYSSLLFAYVLGDQVADGPSPSLFDENHRNHVEEFDNWVWLALAAYHRCPNVPGADDPVDGSCFAFSTAHWPNPASINRVPLYADPEDPGIPENFRYLWIDPLGPGPGGALDPDHVAPPSQSCRPTPGIPWRALRDVDTAGAARQMLDEGGFGAYDEMLLGYGGLMRMLAARDPLAPANPADVAVYDQRRSDVIRPWYGAAYDQVKRILALYRTGYGYAPTIENAACIGTDPQPGSVDRTVLPWQYATADTVASVTRRRATWYSHATQWYWWYDSEWMDIDGAAW